jgi:hypothetical protein
MQGLVHASSRVYRPARGWITFILSLGTLLGMPSILGVWYFGTGHETKGARDTWMMVGICLAFVLLSAYLVAWILRYRVTLTADAIEYSEVLGQKRFSRSQFSGWRIQPSTPSLLVLTPKETSLKAAKIAMVFALDETFCDWLDTLTDLDEEVATVSSRDILENSEIGATAKEREVAFERGRLLSKIVNAAGCFVGLWGFVYPRPYGLAIGALFVLPWVAVEIVHRSRGLFRLDAAKKDLHPNVALAFLVPSMILMLRGVLDFSALNWWRLVAYGALLAVVLCAKAKWADSSMGKKQTVAFYILAFCYGLGAASAINGYFDGSDPVLYRATVLGKHVSYGRTTTYRLTLVPWGPRTAENTVEIPKAMYDVVNVGDSVCPSVKRGALGVAWYDVFGCP